MDKNIEIRGDFVKVNNSMHVNINNIKRISTVDMKRFYCIVSTKEGLYERYEITKDMFFFLKKIGIPHGNKKARSRKK